MKQERDGKLRALADKTDRLLIPIAGGMLSILVLVQCVTWIPSIRSRVDAAAGRFVDVTSVSESESQSDPIRLHIYVSPSQPSHTIQVYRNHQYVLAFSTPSQTIEVHNGDIINVQSTDDATVYVGFDTDSAKVIVPPSGYQAVLNAEQTDAEIGPIKSLQ